MVVFEEYIRWLVGRPAHLSQLLEGATGQLCSSFIGGCRVTPRTILETLRFTFLPPVKEMFEDVDDRGD